MSELLAKSAARCALQRREMTPLYCLMTESDGALTAKATRSPQQASQQGPSSGNCPPAPGRSLLSSHVAPTLMPSSSTPSPTTRVTASRRSLLYTLLLPILLAAAVGLYTKSSFSALQLTPGRVTWGSSSAAAPPFPATTPYLPGTRSPYVEILNQADRFQMTAPPIVVGPQGKHTATVIFSQCVPHPDAVSTFS